MVSYPCPPKTITTTLTLKHTRGFSIKRKQTFGEFGIQGLEDREDNAQTGGDLVVDVKDIDVLNKFDAGIDDDEPPPCDEVPTYYARDSDVDSDDENPRHNYESDGEGLLCLYYVLYFIMSLLCLLHFIMSLLCLVFIFQHAY